MENNKDNKETTPNSPGQSKILRCINIDCVFNSSVRSDKLTNRCSHPNLNIESGYADITIAICSEFRSRKDYSFEIPTVLIDLKSGERREITGKPDPSMPEVEKITSKDLEDSISPTEDNGDEKLTPEDISYNTPNVISEKDERQRMLEEHYRLSTDTTTDFLLLKRLYRPYLKRGIVISVLSHLLVIWFLYLSVIPKENNHNSQNNQRIVVVEDIETPKIDLPDIEDPYKEEEKEVKDNTEDIRPKITPKMIKPKIIRPKDNSEQDTNKSQTNVNDSLKKVTDSLLAAQNKFDTTRLNIPDSLKSIYSEDAIGMSLWFPKNWKLTDNRAVNLTNEQFKGVIVNTDSLSDDPGAVTIFIQIDDSKFSAFNKTTFKNPFQMDDTLSTAFATDPIQTGNRRISYKFFIFTDPSGQKNVFVNSETKKELFEKYRKYIDAIVRSIRIVSKPNNTP